MRVFGLIDLVGEVDQELRVALDDEALDAEADRGPSSGEEALVFGNVVGDLGAFVEAELDSVVELVPSWRGDHNASPRAVGGEPSVKMHGPTV